MEIQLHTVLFIVIVLIFLSTKLWIENNKMKRLKKRLSREVTYDKVVELHHLYKKYLENNLDSSILNFELWLEKLTGSTLLKGGGERILRKDIHTFFGLSYASYLVIPRSILQSSSVNTQHLLVKVLEKITEEVGDWERSGNYYTIRCKNKENKYTKDPFKDYNRGERIVTPNTKTREGGEVH